MGSGLQRHPQDGAARDDAHGQVEVGRVGYDGAQLLRLDGEQQLLA
jgi:hypothetical protein